MRSSGRRGSNGSPPSKARPWRSCSMLSERPTEDPPSSLISTLLLYIIMLAAFSRIDLRHVPPESHRSCGSGPFQLPLEHPDDGPGFPPGLPQHPLLHAGEEGPGQVVAPGDGLRRFDGAGILVSLDHDGVWRGGVDPPPSHTQIRGVRGPVVGNF